MNYEDMSDFEINKRVALYTGKHASNELEDLKNGSCYLMTDVLGVRVTFNPCKFPSDAWPIIVENGILLKFLPKGGNEYAVEELWVAGRRNFKTFNKNPLRAAMICFLKMKDAEQ